MVGLNHVFLTATDACEVIKTLGQEFPPQGRLRVYCGLRRSEFGSEDQGEVYASVAVLHLRLHFDHLLALSPRQRRGPFFRLVHHLDEVDVSGLDNQYER